MPAVHRRQAVPLPRQRGDAADGRAAGAAGRRSSRKDFDFGELVETVLRSNLFFSTQAYRARIKSPVDFALGHGPGLEGRMGTTMAPRLTAALETLGQNVFYPPSVKGWDGGPAWLNGQTLLFRQNLALACAADRPATSSRPTALRLAAGTARRRRRPGGLLPRPVPAGRRAGGDAQASRRLRSRRPASRSCRRTGRPRTPPTTASSACATWC